jgi:hypothetical protein
MFGLNENELAGQWEFWTQAATPKRILFPFDETRSPFYTRFRERTPGPGPKRTIKLFAMHTSPKYAKKGVLKLAKVHELVPAVDEVTVVVGDFNVDTFTNRAGYDKLIGAVGGGVANLGMTMAFRSEDAGAIQLSRRPYCLTHLLPTNRATPNGLLGGVAPSPVQDVYPRFGYMGSMGKKNFKTPVDTGALDNVLTRYGGGLAVGPATNATIVNTVVGRPYNALTPAPANVTVELTGGLPVTPRLLNPILLPVGQDSTSIGAAFGTALFRTWPNFGRLHSTSDHLALVIDV